MLNFASNRVDYGVQLRPPAGYVFDAGIATTYSVDLETLVAASMALSLDQTVEGDLSGEKLAFLESLDRLQDRLVVFYQSGKVNVPVSFNRLFGLLEPLLVPVPSPGGAFASFHPKVWLLRFSPLVEDEPIRFRMMVLSRNLTSDRSWDIAVVVDGTAVSLGGNTDSRLLAFARSLPTDAKQEAFVEAFCDVLQAVDWATPPGFDTFEILPGNPEHGQALASVPLKLDGQLDDLLVVSPFVDAGDASMLAHLGAHARRSKTLISRADTLDRIGPEALNGWTCLSMAQSVVDGEERLEQKQPARQDLHAKLVVTSSGKHATWHAGSPNMTNAAMGQNAGKVAPRNTELAVRLTGANRSVGPAKLLEDWGRSGVFQEHDFADPSDEAAYGDPRLRQLIFQLASATWALGAVETNQDVFRLTLKVTPHPALPSGFSVDVGLLSAAANRPLESEMTWDDLGLTDISAFVRIEVTAPALGIHERFAVQAFIAVDLMEARKKAVFKAIVDTPEKVLRYLTLLLDTEATKTGWLRAGEPNGGGADVFGFDLRGGFYEQLLRSASRAPHRLTRVLKIFERLSEQEAPLPAGLRELLMGFNPQPAALR